MDLQTSYPVVVADRLAACRDLYVGSLGFEVVFEASWFLYLSASAGSPHGIAFMAPRSPVPAAWPGVPSEARGCSSARPGRGRGGGVRTAPRGRAPDRASTDRRAVRPAALRASPIPRACLAGRGRADRARAGVLGCAARAKPAPERREGPREAQPPAAGAPEACGDLRRRRTPRSRQAAASRARGRRERAAATASSRISGSTRPSPRSARAPSGVTRCHDAIFVSAASRPEEPVGLRVLRARSRA